MCFPSYHGSIPKEVVLPRRRRELAGLRRVRDRIDREYARPLDVEALARGTHMAPRDLSREFQRAYGESPYRYLMARRASNAP
jgi:AraC-like DNA-binding protein